MVNKQTLLILGAGASKEAKLPTGHELKETISSLLDIHFDEPGHTLASGDNLILDALYRFHSENPKLASDINDYLHAAWRIRDAMPQALSIDNFIDSNRGNSKIEICGKLGIVRSVLQAEKQSLLFVSGARRDSTIDWRRISSTWFNSFWKILTENCKAEEMNERLKSISVISFNYDRCLEHFLFHSFQNYYGLAAEESAKVVQLLEVYHPYGVVGHLPWQGGEGAIEFGGQPNSRHLLELARQIRTFTEGTDPLTSEIDAIRAKVASSQILVFLGFAYHKLNMDLLRPTKDQNSIESPASCYGTAFEISISDCDHITEEIRRFKTRAQVVPFIRNDLTCEKLFKEYWRSLSIS